MTLPTEHLFVERSHTDTLLYLNRCIKKQRTSARRGLLQEKGLPPFSSVPCYTLLFKEQYTGYLEATAYANICNSGGGDSIKLFLAGCRLQNLNDYCTS